MEQTLTIENKRTRLVAFLAAATDEKIGALYTLLKEQVEEDDFEIPEEEWAAMEAEWEAYKRGEIKTISKEEFFQGLEEKAKAVAA